VICCPLYTLCNVLIAHIPSSAFINDDERGLHQDYDDWLEQLAPHEPISKYRHNRTDEDACPGPRDRLATPISSGRSWAARWWWQSPTGGSTLARGS
jgi:hypothetical protein